MSHSTKLVDDKGREWVAIHNGDWSGDVTLRRFGTEGAPLNEIEEEHVLPIEIIRKLRAKIPSSAAGMSIEEAQQPRNIVQLIPAGEHLFCVCDDGTSWELAFNPLGRRSWQLLPKPGLPTPVPKGWEKYEEVPR